MPESSLRQVPIHVNCQSDARVNDLSIALKELRTIRDVLDWCLEQTPARAIDEMVTQDEYTHDFIVAFDEDCYLVFDTT